MTPRKVPLTKIYFLEVDNDIEGEMTIDEAFRIAGEQSSWKADVFQDGNSFKLTLTCLELAGDWLNLVELMKKDQIIYWRTSDEFTPAVECDGTDIFISVNNPIVLDDSTSDISEFVDDTYIYRYLEEKYEDIDWSDIYNNYDKNDMNYVYLVIDNNNNLALLHTEEYIDSVKILNEWLDYYYDTIDYNIKSLSLAELLTIHSLDDRLSERLYNEFIKDMIVIEDADGE